MTIGEKIKQIRLEKKLSQENVYPSNQSLVSQIEKGVNKNPTEQTLRIMANNMDISFEELIEGTDWDIPRNLSRKSEYAFSQTECVVTIDDSGEIISKMKSYPLKEDSGEENKFDPDTGYKLLTECTNCKRAIQQLEQAHCFGCGEKLFNDYSWFRDTLSTYEYFNQFGHIISRDKVNEITDDTSGLTKREYIETGYTRNLTINLRITRYLSWLLEELMTINAIIDRSERYTEGKELHKRTVGILQKIIHEQYNPYFSKYYYTMTKDQVNFSGVMAGATEDMAFHTSKPIGPPIGYSEGEDAWDTIDNYDGVFALYDLVNMNPNNVELKGIKDWWVAFKHDLSMTKGLLNEMLRHQKRLIEAEEMPEDEAEETPKDQD